jgi:hypothetical protein
MSMSIAMCVACCMLVLALVLRAADICCSSWRVACDYHILDNIG